MNGEQIFNLPVIDINGVDSAGQFDVNQALPGGASNQDLYILEAWGVINIADSATWTFGVVSDDGFELSITGPLGTPSPTTQVISYNDPRSMQDTRDSLLLTPGNYNIHLIFFEVYGGDGVELYACPGSVNTDDWDGCFLIGDSDPNALKVKTDASTVPAMDFHGINPFPAPTFTCPRQLGMNVVVKQSATTVADLDDAGKLLAGTTAAKSTTSVVRSMIDFEGDLIGHWYSGLNYPGFLPGEEPVNTVVQVSGVLDIPTTGWYTFGVNSDDGFSLVIDGGLNLKIGYIEPRIMSDTAGSTWLTAGEHTFRLVHWHEDGPGGIEFWATFSDVYGGELDFFPPEAKRVGDPDGIRVWTAPSTQCLP